MKPPLVHWTERARSDLLEIGEHIAIDKPVAAGAWVGRLIACAEEAALAPLAHRRVLEVDRDDVREALLARYRIVFRVKPKGILVLSVLEGHKRLDEHSLSDDDGDDR